jgi:hypothetical protein
MTVIAYDGRYVAGDTLIVNDGGLRNSCGKLRIWETQVLATTGAADHGEALVIWFKDGKKPAAFPNVVGSQKDGSLYVFEYGKPIMCFQTYPAPIIFTGEEFACGSGGEIARAALHLGRDARQAVDAAIELNVYCGGDIEYIDLRKLAETGSATVMCYDD